MDHLNTIPTDALIAELMSRQSFCGVLIWLPGYAGVDSSDWQWKSMNCDAQTVCEQVAANLTAARIAAAAGIATAQEEPDVIAD